MPIGQFEEPPAVAEGSFNSVGRVLCVAVAAEPLPRHDQAAVIAAEEARVALVGYTQERAAPGAAEDHRGEVAGPADEHPFGTAGSRRGDDAGRRKEALVAGPMETKGVRVYVVRDRLVLGSGY
jgi:hypothetical protein